MRYRLLAILLIAPLFLLAQVKSLRAVKTALAPRIDGSLDDEAWKNAPVATDFITNSPSFGQPASTRSEVKLVYDNTAVYIGAYLYDNPWQIRWQLNQRDQEQGRDVDYFSVFLDTYQDKQNGFQFLVTSRNVQSDSRLSPAVETSIGTYGDLNWDAVWESQVSIKSDGWVVEMRIPYSSIRFSKKDVQEWGVNFLRFTRRINESAFWNPVDPNESGFVNQFGSLTGLKDLKPPLRLSFSPYVSAGYKSTPHDNSSPTSEFLKSGGMDLKYGIDESFTLDATLIPDFGQVISDNVVNNISPYEIRFQENRSFFTEGTELFNKAGIFYSRRVGGQPHGYNEVENFASTHTDYSLVKNPASTKLYNGIKFSGRNKNNLGIGIFNAITQPVRAVLHNTTTGKDSIFTTEAKANYNIVVFDKALKNRSSVTFTNTNVLRNGKEPDANVTALDLSFYDKKNQYGLSFRPRYSIITGDDGYDGFKNTIEFGKVSGKLQFSVINNIESDRYDPNDLGFLSAANKVANTAEISYNLVQPAGNFLNQRYALNVQHISLYKPLTYQQFILNASSSWLLANFWKLAVELETTPGWYYDFFELQTPGKKLRKAPYYFMGSTGSSDIRKRLYASWELGFAEGPLRDDPYYKISLNMRYRFGDNFSLEAGYEREYDNGQFGYAFERETNGDPILARRKYAQVTTLLSGIYNFTPRMNIVFRSRHYWNRLINTNSYNVNDDGSWTERLSMIAARVNYNTFNFDLFYTWDFRLGSRIILGYKNWLNPTFGIDGNKYHNYSRNFLTVMNGSQHGNELTIRFIYYLDYQDIRKK